MEPLKSRRTGLLLRQLPEFPNVIAFGPDGAIAGAARLASAPGAHQPGAPRGVRASMTTNAWANGISSVIVRWMKNSAPPGTIARSRAAAPPVSRIVG